MNEFKLGLVSISFRKYSVEEIIKALKKAGLRFIEWGSDVHAPFNDIEKLNKIASMQKENDIECSSYGTYFKLGTDDLGKLEEYIEAAKILGTDILRLWCGDKNPLKYSKEEKENLFEECKKAGKIAQKHNVTLCMECHQNTYTEEKEAALELMNNISSPHFKMYWQPNQFRKEDENTEYLKLLLPHILHIHVFNWENENRYPLELAKKEWKQYLSNLKEKHTLLLEFMPDDKIESLDKEAYSLKKFLEDLV